MLTNLYASTNGASWTNKTNWNGPVGTECTWYGVTCDGTQSHVYRISLYKNNLVGTLPAFSGLTALVSFSAGNNPILGGIPNQLSGSIPSLSGLTALQVFYVNGNQLTGPVPAAPTSLLAGSSNLCGNSLVSSGNPTIDAAWVAAAGNWLACQYDSHVVLRNPMQKALQSGSYTVDAANVLTRRGGQRFVCGRRVRGCCGIGFKSV